MSGRSKKVSLGIAAFGFLFLVASWGMADLAKLDAIFMGLGEEAKSIIITVKTGDGLKDARMEVDRKTKVRLKDGTPSKLEEVSPGDKLEISYRKAIKGEKKVLVAVIIVVIPSPQ